MNYLKLIAGYFIHLITISVHPKNKKIGEHTPESCRSGVADRTEEDKDVGDAMCLLARGLSLDRGTNSQRRLQMLILGRREGGVGRRWSSVPATVSATSAATFGDGNRQMRAGVPGPARLPTPAA